MFKIIKNKYIYISLCIYTYNILKLNRISNNIKIDYGNYQSRKIVLLVFASVINIIYIRKVQTLHHTIIHIIRKTDISHSEQQAMLLCSIKGQFKLKHCSIYLLLHNIA